LRATEFEFRIRFFIILAIFVAGFLCYALDPVSVSAMLAGRLLGYSIDDRVARARHLVQAFIGLGAVLAVLAAMLRTWATAYLRSEVVFDWNLHGEGLVADGPFRYVRNPLYLGGILFGAGFGMAASRLGFAVIVGGLTMLYLRLIAREEHLLSETQGNSYRAYLQAVPRLIPSFKARIPAGNTVPRWRQAVIGEAFGWLFAVALICFAATLNVSLLRSMLIAGLAASLLAKATLRRSSALIFPPPDRPSSRRSNSACSLCAKGNTSVITM
jgi:protein-S-isoprenylcysteine O-methyltransferase Ste14